MNRRYVNNRTFIWLIIIVALIIYGSSRELSFGFFGTPKLQETLSFDISAIDKIEVMLSSFDVVVEEYNGNDIKVEVYSNLNQKDSPSIMKENKVLKIIENKNLSIGFNIRFENNRVNIFIPKNEALEYNIVTSSGDIKSLNIESLSFIAKTTSGDINIIDNRGNIIDLQTTSGDIESNVITIDCFANTTSGDIKLNLKNKADQIEARSTSGDIKLNVLEARVVDVKSTSGEVSGNIGVDQLIVHTTSGDINIDLIKMPNEGVKANAVSGDIELKLPKNDGFTLDYSTTSGDVRNEFTGLKGEGSGRDKYAGGSVVIQTITTSGDIDVEK